MGADGSVALIARFTLIEGAPAVPPWKFSRSFPNLPPFASGIKVTNEKAGPPSNTLDTLMLSDAAFVISTADHATNSVTGAPLEPGLNFVARIVPTGLLGLFETILSGGQRLVLHGRIIIPKATEATLPPPSRYLIRFPWQLPNQPPGIMLRADVPIDLKLGSALRLHNACMRIYCPTSKTWADANPNSPYLAASSDLDIPSAHVTVQLTALGLSRQRTSLVGCSRASRSAGWSTWSISPAVTTLASYLPMTCARRRACWKASACRQSDRSRRRMEAGVRRGDGRTRQSEHQGAFRLHGRQPDGQLLGLRAVRPQRAVSVMVGGHVQFATAPLDVAIELPEVRERADHRRGQRADQRAGAGCRDPGARHAGPADQRAVLQMEIAGDGSFAVFASVAAHRHGRSISGRPA